MSDSSRTSHISALRKRLLNWVTGANVPPENEIRKGGIGHNKVVEGVYVCGPANGPIAIHGGPDCRCLR